MKQLAIRFGKLDPTKYRDPPLTQSVSGGNPVTNDEERYKTELFLNELVDTVVVNDLATSKAEYSTEDCVIETVLNEMVDKVVYKSIVDSYAKRATDKLIKDVTDRYNSDDESSGSEYDPLKCDSDQSSISTYPDSDEEVLSITAEDAATENVTTGDAATENVTTGDTANGDAATENVATGDAATGDVATKDVTTKEKEIWNKCGTSQISRKSNHLANHLSSSSSQPLNIPIPQ